MLNNWNSPGPDLKLLEHEVHVWRAPLVVSPEIFAHLQRMLLPAETARAQRFYFAKDRDHWTVARAVLRIILARYLALEPLQLQFSTNSYGKPSLASLPHTTPLHFNISHSHELALYAFSWRRELGVDVEYMRTGFAFEEVAQHSFSSSENALLRTLPEEAKPQAFFNCWTRKEAYIKARGMGLSLPLDLFDVSLIPGEPAALLASREDPHEVTRWTFQALDPGAGYAGALAVESSGWQLRCWEWSL